MPRRGPVGADRRGRPAIAKGGFDPWTLPNDKMQKFVKDDIDALTADIKALDIKAQ